MTVDGDLDPDTGGKKKKSQTKGNVKADKTDLRINASVM